MARAAFLCSFLGGMRGKINSPHPLPRPSCTPPMRAHHESGPHPDRPTRIVNRLFGRPAAVRPTAAGPVSFCLAVPDHGLE